MTFLLRQSGEVNGDPSNLVVGTARAAGIIAVMPWLVRYLFEFGVTLQSDVVSMDVIGNVTNVNSSTFSVLTQALAEAGNLILFYGIGVIVSLCFLLIIMVQSFIRAADLIVQAWTGSFSALGLTNSQSQTWNRWFWDTLGIGLTAALQLALIKLSFYCLAPINVSIGGSIMPLPPIVSLFLFIAVLWVAYRSPITLKEKLHVTGTGKVGGAVAQMSVQSFVMRSMKR